jgi:mRNA interferase RelE/StbE
MYQIIFEKKAKKHFYNLDRTIQQRIAKAIHEKLIVNPQQYLIPLTGDKAGLYKFRVGNYRLLCNKKDKQLRILVVKVKHRKEIYKH